MRSAASSRFRRATGPLTASVFRNVPAVENQWQPGSCIATVTTFVGCACVVRANEWVVIPSTCEGRSDGDRRPEGLQRPLVQLGPRELAEQAADRLDRGRGDRAS